jgi:intracellular multiplication protein IcmE
VVGASATTAAATPTQLTLLGAGAIESARMDTGLNTDIGGDFGATVVTGKYAGAKLVGTYSRKGELAVGQVRLMAFPNQGVSVPVNAVILDPETAEGGTASDVDRKLFVKYGIKPLAAGFAAVADYLKNSGTTVVVDGQTVTSTQPELTNKRAGQIVVGSAAQQVSSDANALDTTPTVRVRRNTIVGVFFTQDVVYTPKQ